MTINRHNNIRNSIGKLERLFTIVTSKLVILMQRQSKTFIDDRWQLGHTFAILYLEEFIFVAMISPCTNVLRYLSTEVVYQ